MAPSRIFRADQITMCLMLLLWLLYLALAEKFYYEEYIVKEVAYRRLCHTKRILTVNGQFPGPILHVFKGETAYVKVYNRGNENITLHWHGVKQPRNPWSDGPAYVTQCPIVPGSSFIYKIIFSNEEGTLWWHAHSEWTRATVHGAIIIHPKPGTSYPFPEPYNEVPIILGEWWRRDVNEVVEEAIKYGGVPNVSDAFTINGQPGDLYPCSKPGTFRMPVKGGKAYLLRVINAALNDELFFSVAKHRLTVVGIDASYTKPLRTSYIMITPGQTMDVLLEANQAPDDRYYMAATAYSSGTNVSFDNTTTTAIVEYVTPRSENSYCHFSSRPWLPSLPSNNDTNAATKFTRRLRSLASEDHPIDVPMTINERLLITVSVNTLACLTKYCEGPNGTRLSSSLNNISFVTPEIDLLGAYYYRINGVFGNHFPKKPPRFYNFTADEFPGYLLTPRQATEVRLLKHNANVEITMQGTNLVAGENHPMHLHGYSFYVVGWGFGNYDKDKDPANYNLVDPPEMNTVGVPKNGWVALRFRASNPGVWFMHCHLERHLSWGMNTVFIVKSGKGIRDRLQTPPPYMPPC